MKNFLLLFLIFIPLSYSYIHWKCFQGYSICCRLSQNNQIYDYFCLCYPDNSLDSLPYGYKIYKTCTNDNNEEPKCIQNNLYSSEIICTCEKK